MTDFTFRAVLYLLKKEEETGESLGLQKFSSFFPNHNTGALETTFAQLMS